MFRGDSKFDGVPSACDLGTELLLVAIDQLGSDARQHDLGVGVPIAHELVEASAVFDSAVHDDRDPVADHLHVREDVGVHEDGLALRVESQDEIADLLAADRIEAAHGLVEEHDLRIVDQRLRDADALEHPLGVGPQTRVLGVGKADLLEERLDALFVFARSVPGQLRVEGQELATRQVVVEVGVLGEEADVLPVRAFRHIVAEDGRRSLGRVDQTHQDLQCGGLARAVGPDKAEYLPLVHFEGNPVENALRLSPEARLKILDQIAHYDERVPVSGHACSAPQLRLWMCGS